MKIVFFGSSEIAVPSLARLIESPHDILAVVTRPDRAKGRSLKPEPTPVKKKALSKHLNVYQPENLPDAPAREYLTSLSPDLFVVVSFGEILPESILAIPELYSVNLHPSLLPKYRGAAPINWAIINGDTETGLTVIRMNEKMDAGDIMMQRKVEIRKEDTSQTLSERLSELGAVLLMDTVRFLEAGQVKFKKQNDKAATSARLLSKEDGLIDWQRSASEIHNLARGLVPWPCAYTYLEGKMLKIWKTEVVSPGKNPNPGSVVELHEGKVVVACGKNLLAITELQLEGKKKMDAASFLRGYKLEVGTVLGEIRGHNT